jgi:hypothetical protein
MPPATPGYPGGPWGASSWGSVSRIAGRCRPRPGFADLGATRSPTPNLLVGGNASVNLQRPMPAPRGRETRRQRGLAPGPANVLSQALSVTGVAGAILNEYPR